MSVIRKLRRVYDEKKAEVNATVQANQLPFTEWLMREKPELYAETLKANEAGKKPPKLIARVTAEYVKWSANRK